MAKYEVRITNDENGIVAWIDQDGLKCIMQPHLPGETEGWKTEAEAKAWADDHAAKLLATHEAGIAAEIEKKEREDAAHQANLALIAILEKLTAQA